MIRLNINLGRFFPCLNVSRFVFCVWFVLFLQCSSCGKQHMGRADRSWKAGLESGVNDGLRSQISHKNKRSLPANYNTAPIISVPPKSTVVKPGETAILYCGAQGHPSPAITWQKVNGSLPSLRVFMHSSQGILMIHNVKQSDQGTYICTAKNTAPGEATAFAMVTVKKNVFSRAEILKIPSSMIIEEGQKIALRCEATGVPVPVVTWSRALAAIRTPAVHSKIENNGKQDVVSSILTIYRVSVDDSGLYICTASNSVNAVQKTTLLFVVRSRKFGFSTKPPAELQAIEGQHIYLDCQANNSDSIQWTLPTYTSSRSVQHINGTLEIIKVVPRDHGVITCQASHKAYGILQTISTTTHLNVIEESYGLEHSTILSRYPAKCRQTLTAYLGPVVKKTSRWIRCWNAVIDGWDARTKFHGQCDNKGPTLTIVRYHEYVFGGYTNIEWKMRGDYAGRSPFKSFLFSLSNIYGYHPVKMLLRGVNNYEAIYDSRFNGPIFGSGHDLKLVRDVGVWNHDSYAKPNTYFAPPGCEYDKFCTFYTGRQKFIPHDIEVFYQTSV